MECIDARAHLLDLLRERLAPTQRAEVERHLETCAACRRAAEVEGLLERLLRERLPRPAAPAGLRQHLETLRDAAAAAPGLHASSRHARRARWTRLALPAVAAALLAGAGGWLAARRLGPDAGASALADELVTDHLRVLARTRPADVESGDRHAVKPWFEGRLDFAPEVPPDGGELRLLGGSVGYVLGRKAAVISYVLRRHAVTLLVFPAAGLGRPEAEDVVAARPVSVRGFHLVRWRAGELEYALVSDAAPADVRALAERMAPATSAR